MYNYLENMVEDIKEYVKNEIDFSEYYDMDELREFLNDDLWTEDSVTGNASGSYTFNRETAKEYVDENKDLVNDMMEELDCKGLSYLMEEVKKE